MLGLVVAVAVSFFAGDWLSGWRDSGRPLPPAIRPTFFSSCLTRSELTVCSLYGYERPTTPNLERLSKRGIRFDNARATAPWTLASHASMFTGHWPHDVGATWMTPLRGNLSMLAEYVGEHGYATAGFIANLVYCSREQD